MCDYYPKVFSREKPVARKAHVCCECGGRIDRKEAYELVRGLWDEWASYKTCATCAELRAEINATIPANMLEESPVFGDLRSWLAEDFVEGNLRGKVPGDAEAAGRFLRFMANGRARGAGPSKGGWLEKVEQQASACVEMDK